MELSLCNITMVRTVSVNPQFAFFLGYDSEVLAKSIDSIALRHLAGRRFQRALKRTGPRMISDMKANVKKIRITRTRYGSSLFVSVSGNRVSACFPAILATIQ